MKALMMGLACGLFLSLSGLAQETGKDLAATLSRKRAELIAANQEAVKTEAANFQAAADKHNAAQKALDDKLATLDPDFKALLDVVTQQRAAPVAADKEAQLKARGALREAEGKMARKRMELLKKQGEAVKAELAEIKAQETALNDARKALDDKLASLSPEYKSLLEQVSKLNADKTVKKEQPKKEAKKEAKHEKKANK